MTSAPATSLAASLAPVVFVTGKGGVGKTTIAAALAMEAVDRGEPASFVEFGDGEAGMRTLGEASSRIRHVVVDFDRALLETVADIFNSRTLAKVFVGHSAMRRLLRAAPGVSELIKLDAVRRLAEITEGRIVVDLPASGHAVGWLRVGASLSRFASAGPLHEVARRTHELIQDRSRSSVVVVTLPEPLVLKETAELCASLRDEVGRAADAVAINRSPDPHETPAELAAVLRALGDAGSGASALAELVETRGDTRRLAREALGTIDALSLGRVLQIPETVTDPEPADFTMWITAVLRRELPCPA